MSAERRKSASVQAIERLGERYNLRVESRKVGHRWEFTFLHTGRRLRTVDTTTGAFRWLDGFQLGQRHR